MSDLSQIPKSCLRVPRPGAALRSLGWSTGASLGVHLAAFAGAVWLTLSSGRGSERSVAAIGYVAAVDPSEDLASDAEPERELVPPEAIEPQLIEQSVDAEPLLASEPRATYAPAPEDSDAIAAQLDLQWGQGRIALDTGSGAAAASVSVAQPPSAVAGAEGSPAPDPVVVPAKLVVRTEPEYPRLSRRLDEQGTLTVRIDVAEDGTVRDVTLVTTSGHERLDRAALDAIASWRFEPATRDGVRIPWSIDHRVTFALSDSDAAR
jgi:TonB family protein